jgi:hypothetical protein
MTSQRSKSCSSSGNIKDKGITLPGNAQNFFTEDLCLVLRDFPDRGGTSRHREGTYLKIAESSYFEH